MSCEVWLLIGALLVGIAIEFRLKTLKISNDKD